MQGAESCDLGVEHAFLEWRCLSLPAASLLDAFRYLLVRSGIVDSKVANDLDNDITDPFRPCMNDFDETDHLLAQPQA